MKNQPSDLKSALTPHFGYAVAEASSVLLWVANTEKQCIYFNRAWLDYRGRTLEEESGFGWAEGVHADDYQRCLDVYTKAFDARQKFSINYRLKKSDGFYGWIQDDGAPYFDEEGIFQGYIGSCFDITESKNSLNSLKEQGVALENANLRLSEAVKAGKVGIWDWDVENDVLIWDEQMFNIYGMARNENVNTFSLWENAVYFEDKDFAVSAFGDAVRGVKNYDIEFRIKRSDGMIRYLKADATVLKNDLGQPYRVLGTNIDITERKSVEDKIRALEKRNRALLDYSPVCHKIVDLEFKLRYMNANGFNMLRLPINDECYGKPYPFEFFDDTAQRIMKEQLTSVKTNKKQTSFESIAQDNSGNELWLYHTIIPVFTDKGDELDYLTVVSADISQQKEYQEQLRHREKMDAIGQLAGGVAHDFNNQLASILGYAQLLESEVSSEKSKKFATKIIKAAEHSAKLTKQMLTFSRKQKLVVDTVDIHKLITDTLDFVSHSIDKRIAVDTALLAKNSRTLGDRTQLHSAFLNLTINAADAMVNGGTLTITTENVDARDDKLLKKQKSVKPGEYIKALFRDSGTGIKAQDLTKVFDPFFTTKPIGKGTGMGLASVYGTVKHHSGYLFVESEWGVGTSFYLYFPVSESADSKAKRMPTETANDVSPNQLQQQILVVDDEELIREMCSDILTELGYRVMTAINGKDAIDKYRLSWQDIDLVVLDLAMPVMNGADAYEELKQINPNVKVIVSSGYDRDSSSISLRSNGVADFIEKPFKIDTLRTKVREVLR